MVARAIQNRKRVMVAILAISGGAMLFTVSGDAARACGGFFCQAVPINQAGEQIIFRQDGDMVTAVVLIQYAGDAEDFSWVLPVPGIPSFSIGSDVVFGPLELATRPQFNLTVVGEECALRGRGGFGFDATFANDNSDVVSIAEDEGVVILEELSVGPFDIAVVTSDDAEAMALWLEENDFDLTDRGAELIAPYVRDGMNFVAMKLQQDRGVGDIQPLILQYRGDKPMIPIRLTAVAAVPDMGILVWLLGESRAVPINYLEVEPNLARLNWYSGQFSAYASYQNLVTAAMDEAGGLGFAVDYAGRNLDVLSQLPDPDSLGDELDRLAAIADLDEFFVDLVFNRFFNQSKVMEILRRRLPLPDGIGEFAYSSPEVLFTTFELDELFAARDAIVGELRSSVIDPLSDTLAVFDGMPYMTRLYTTLSPEEMTEDPEFGFNKDIVGQPLEREATLTLDCVRGQTQWRLMLGPGTGRDGEVVLRGYDENPLFNPPVVDQPAVRVAARVGAVGQPEIVLANDFAVFTIGEAAPASIIDLCGGGVLSATLLSFAGLTLFAVSRRRNLR